MDSAVTPERGGAPPLPVPTPPVHTAPTPTDSARRLEASRIQRLRTNRGEGVGTSPASPEAARSMGASGIAASEFPDLRWKEHQLGSKLPVLLYLTHHDRDMKTKKG
ncbi:unnamed protein product, partial [Pylaiella littoralis]